MKRKHLLKKKLRKLSLFEIFKGKDVFCSFLTSKTIDLTQSFVNSKIAQLIKVNTFLKNLVLPENRMVPEAIAVAGNKRVDLRRARLISFSILMLFSVCLLWTGESLAAFNLNVSPYEGGFDLSYGSVKNGVKLSKEVSMRVTSDIGKQYRIIQTYTPITNTKGSTIPTSSFRVYTLRGSNSSGTLGYDVEAQVFQGAMTIYTSNPFGSSDSFVVVYGLEVPDNQDPGFYRGRLVFSLEPINSLSQSPITKTLNISVEVTSSANFKVTTSSGSSVIRLKSLSEKEQTAEKVYISINGFLGSQYRIIQKASSPLRNSSGELLPRDSVLVSAKEATQGKISIGNSLSLSDSDTLIYTSDQQGSPDEIVLTYALADQDLVSGFYRGALTYIVESTTSLKQGEVIGTLQIEVDVRPIFDLLVRTDNSGKISFRDLKPDRPPQISSSYIEVESNTKKAYQVIQNVSSLLVNEDGKTIPKGFFKLKTESDESREGLTYPSEVSVEKGQMILFTSKDGNPAKFKVVYKLDVPVDVHSGNYSTGITYSLLEL